MNKFEFKHQEDINLINLTIDGKRVVLKSIDKNFSQDIFREFTSEITTYMIPKPAETEEEILAFISQSLNAMKERHDLTLVILLKESNEFLGCCGLHSKGEPNTPELGIWLKKSAHGNKYGLESIKLLLSWADLNINFEFIKYPVEKRNISSRKIPESLGGIIDREEKVKNMMGKILNELTYKIYI